jgi:putative heme-binding domain-containing protein
MVYDPALANKPVKQRQSISSDLSAGSIEAGKQLFAEHACSACHGVTGGEELLGPNLNGIALRLSRENILEDIKFPSKIIKPSMGAMRIIKKDGQVLLGRVVNADEQQVSIMLIGNKVISVPRKEIQKTENEKKSLMYEGLVNSLNAAEINSLLDYIESLK